MAVRDSIGRRIAAARRIKGMTQVELAAEIGTSRVVISQWERDLRAPLVTSACKLAAALDVPVESLVPGEDRRYVSSELVGRALGAVELINVLDVERTRSAVSAIEDLLDIVERIRKRDDC